MIYECEGNRKLGKRKSQYDTIHDLTKGIQDVNKIRILEFKRKISSNSDKYLVRSHSRLLWDKEYSGGLVVP